MFYPKIMQPTHAKWEQVVDHPSDNQPADTPHIGNNSLVNGDSSNLSPHTSHPRSDTFKPVPDVVSRNLLVADTYFECPPIANPGLPGPDGNITDLGPNGLSTVPQDVMDELPEDCRVAFEQARDAELAWKSKWSTEQSDGSRGTLRIGFNGFPV